MGGGGGQNGQKVSNSLQIMTESCKFAETYTLRCLIAGGGGGGGG